MKFIKTQLYIKIVTIIIFDYYNIIIVTIIILIVIVTIIILRYLKRFNSEQNVEFISVITNSAEVK